MMKKCYIDIDGVILKRRKEEPVDNVHKLISFLVSHFDCYWLTTHCKGDSQTAIDYLSEYLSEADLQLLQSVKATNWGTFKTDAIDFTSDFYWVDDWAMTAEKEILSINGKTDSLILVNDEKEDMVDYIINRLNR